MNELAPSTKVENFIEGWETCRLNAFKPTPNDVWTCGWGATGPDIGPDTVWTQPEADARFDRDLSRFGAGVWLHLTGPTSQQQYDAMVSLSYNIGIANFSASTVLRLHNAGDYTGAAANFADWNKQRDDEGELVVLDGLTKRRTAEAAIYTSGVYDSSH